MTPPSRRAIFTGRNVVLGDGQPRAATVIADVDTGKIVDVLDRTSSRSEFPDVSDADWTDAGNLYILPGICTRPSERARAHGLEGFWTGTRAAASGGVTTVVDMPLNSIPPTTSVANLEEKLKAARGQCWTDAHLKPLVKAGVRGFKCFLIESGVDEFPCVNEADLRLAMHELKGSPTVLCFHAELDKSQEQPALADSADPTLYSTFLASRPQQLEVDAIALITALHREFPNLRLHIVHLSAADALPLIRAAKQSGLPLTVETCFHYLTLSAQHIPHGRPEFKCCPPIREDANREALWAALLDGTIDCVVSDHSPCVASLKKMEEGDIMSAWGGISTLGLGLSLLWTEGRKRGVGIDRIVDWLSVQTAKHAGLSDRKGQLKVGHDADLIVWDPDAQTTVTKESLNFKNKLTPYEGLSLSGVVQRTYVRARLAYSGPEDGFVDLKPIGERSR
ncbi:allantoinase [Cerioporus squamosus]|nr:allantoinase [Cerioporus squamosus]